MSTSIKVAKEGEREEDNFLAKGREEMKEPVKLPKAHKGEDKEQKRQTASRMRLRPQSASLRSQEKDIAWSLHNAFVDWSQRLVHDTMAFDPKIRNLQVKANVPPDSNLKDDMHRLTLRAKKGLPGKGR